MHFLQGQFFKILLFQLHKLEVDSYRADRQRPARSSLISMDCMAADIVKDKLKDISDDYSDLKHRYDIVFM